MSTYLPTYLPACTTYANTCTSILTDAGIHIHSQRHVSKERHAPMHVELRRNACKYTCMHAAAKAQHTQMRARTCTHTHTHTLSLTYIYIYIYICMHTHTCVYIYIIYIYIYIYMYAYTHVYIYIYIHTGICLPSLTFSSTYVYLQLCSTRRCLHLVANRLSLGD